MQELINNTNIDVNLGFEEDRSAKNETTIIRNKSPLYLSVENNNYQAVKLLLAKPNIDANFESIYDNYRGKCPKKLPYNWLLRKKIKKLFCY